MATSTKIQTFLFSQYGDITDLESFKAMILSCEKNLTIKLNFKIDCFFRTLVYLNLSDIVYAFTVCRISFAVQLRYKFIAKKLKQDLWFAHKHR